MLEEGHFLLELLGVVEERVRGHHVLLLGGRDRLPLVVVEQGVFGLQGLRLVVQHDLSRVVEEHARCIVREQVAQPVLRGVVNPLLDPDGGTPQRQLLLVHLRRDC